MAIEEIIKNIGVEEFNNRVIYMARKMGVTENQIINIMDNVKQFKSIGGISKSTRRRFQRYFQCIDRVIEYIEKEIKADFFAEYNELIKKHSSSKEYKDYLDGRESQNIKNLIDVNKKLILPEPIITKTFQNPRVKFVPKPDYSKT